METVENTAMSQCGTNCAQPATTSSASSTAEAKSVFIFPVCRHDGGSVRHSDSIAGWSLRSETFAE
jgi:hypothetical protein